MEQDFGVRMVAAENVSARRELGPELCVIVDLAVEDHGDPFVLVPHRLVPTLDVDDSEPPMAEKHWYAFIIDVETVAIRPPMPERGHHGKEVGTVASADESRNPAHQAQSSKLTRSRTP